MSNGLHPPLLALAALCLFVTTITGRALSPGERWNDLFGQLAAAGGCKWEPKEYAECAMTPKEFEETVKNVLKAPDLQIPVIQDSEFNNKETPRVLLGIRCAPLQYPLRIQGGLFGLGGQEVYEVTQFYIQLLEPEAGVSHFRILIRSAQHSTGDSALRPVSDPPTGWQTARLIKERVLTALNNVKNPP